MYSVSKRDTLVASTPSHQTLTVQTPLPHLPPDERVTVLDHVDGVQQIAVGGVPEHGVSSGQAVAGVRVKNGVATLEWARLHDPSANPWTAISIPGAIKLSTPSFDVDGSAVWTVATTTSGTRLYRVSLDGTNARTLVPVAVSDQEALKDVTSFRISPDGARAVLIGGGQAYVGIVNQQSATTSFSIDGVRPVISVVKNMPDVEVYWADRFNLGVVVQDNRTAAPPKRTALYTVSADGYTLGPDGSRVDRVPVAQSPSGALQFAHAPNQLWVASLNGQLSRQPAPDPDASNGAANEVRPWNPVGGGSWPTYAG
jgi:hypothetical protein